MIDKNDKIRQTLKETKTRRANMTCKTFETKVVFSKLNKQQKEQINQYFREAKWLRNFYIVDFDDNKQKVSEVEIKVNDSFETRQLEILGSQVKQSICKEAKSNLKTLSTIKSKGKKIGKLQFKSYCNMIPLKQFGTTYKIIDDKYIKVQNINKKIYVRGLKQIPSNAEIANAKFVRKPDGLYFYITCYVPKEEVKLTNKQVGVDFGVEHNLNFSDETNPKDISVKETKSIKLLSKKLNKAYKRNGEMKTKNHYKRVLKLKAAYQKNTNKKVDKANKITSELLNSYDFIAIQDEMIHNWHAGLFGKQVQNSAMGLIKAKLKNSSKVYVVERSFPSTQLCPICGCSTKHPLSKREYDCLHCGYHHDSRDKKSAQSILDEALKQVSTERRTQSLVENSSSAFKLIFDGKNLSMKQEAQVL